MFKVLNTDALSALRYRGRKGVECADEECRIVQFIGSEDESTLRVRLQVAGQAPMAYTMDFRVAADSLLVVDDGGGVCPNNPPKLREYLSDIVKGLRGNWPRNGTLNAVLASLADGSGIDTRLSRRSTEWICDAKHWLQLETFRSSASVSLSPKQFFIELYADLRADCLLWKPPETRVIRLNRKLRLQGSPFSNSLLPKLYEARTAAQGDAARSGIPSISMVPYFETVLESHIADFIDRARILDGLIVYESDGGSEILARIECNGTHDPSQKIGIARLLLNENGNERLQLEVQLSFRAGQSRDAGHTDCRIVLRITGLPVSPKPKVPSRRSLKRLRSHLGDTVWALETFCSEYGLCASATDRLAFEGLRKMHAWLTRVGKPSAEDTVRQLGTSWKYGGTPRLRHGDATSVRKHVGMWACKLTGILDGTWPVVQLADAPEERGDVSDQLDGSDPGSPASNFVQSLLQSARALRRRFANWRWPYLLWCILLGAVALTAAMFFLWSRDTVESQNTVQSGSHESSLGIVGVDQPSQPVNAYTTPTVSTHESVAPPPPSTVLDDAGAPPKTSKQTPSIGDRIIAHDDVIRAHPSDPRAADAFRAAVKLATAPPRDSAYAEFADLADIEGAVFQEETGELFIYGPAIKNDTYMPPLLWDDFVVALKVAQSGFSTGLAMHEDRQSDNSQLVVQYHPKFVAQTRLGRVFLEADRQLKALALAQDGMGTPQKVLVLRHRTVLNYSRVLDKSDGELAVPLGLFLTSDMPVIRVEGYAMRFVSFKLKVATRGHNPANAAFADQMTKNFDEYAKHYVVFRELIRLAKLIAVARWYSESGFPVDPILEAHKPLPCKAITSIPAISVHRRVSDTAQVRFFGGIRLQEPSNVSTPKLAEKTIATVISGRPTPDSVAWNINVEGRTLKAIACPLPGRQTTNSR